MCLLLSTHSELCVVRSRTARVLFFLFDSVLVSQFVLNWFELLELKELDELRKKPLYVR